MAISYRIPQGIRFEALRLRRDPVDGGMALDSRVLARIRRANGLDESALATDEEIGSFLMAWYRTHREAGGAADPVMEQILNEARAEEAYGAARVMRGPVGMM